MTNFAVFAIRGEFYGVSCREAMADARAYFHRSDREQRSFFIGKAETSNKVQAFTVTAMISGQCSLRAREWERKNDRWMRTQWNILSPFYVIFLHGRVISYREIVQWREQQTATEGRYYCNYWWENNRKRNSVRARSIYSSRERYRSVIARFNVRAFFNTAWSECYGVSFPFLLLPSYAQSHAPLSPM